MDMHMFEGLFGWIPLMDCLDEVKDLGSLALRAFHKIIA
jgi:hypothetical protein